MQPSAVRSGPRWLAIGAAAVVLVAGCSSGQLSSAPASASAAAASPFDLATIENSIAYIQTQGTFVTANGAVEQVYTGSGFVIDPSGLIVTNNHVVSGGAFWKVQIGTDKTLLDARVLGVSECSDLAVLKVDGNYPALTMSTATPRVGEQIYVAGHPNGDPYTLTNGIVAKPPYPSDHSWASVTQEIQITAQTYPGNSGSPVIDTNGQVIAIQYAAGLPGSDIAGESFAIASAEAVPVIDQLKTGKNLDTIGINGQANSTAKGIAIISVAPGSPADRAGIKPGDLLTDFNGTAVGADGTKASYCSVLRTHTATDSLSVTVQRGGQTLTGEINGPTLAVVNVGGSSAAPEPSGGAAAASTSPGGATAIDQIQPYVPSAWRANCTHSTDQVPSTVLQTAVCSPVSGVDTVWYDLYDSPADLKAAYSTDAQNVSASSSTKCPTGPSDNPWQTTFPTDGNKVLTGPDFRFLCYTDTNNGNAVIEQEDPSTSILVTVVSKGTLTDLYTWWTSNVSILDRPPAN